MQRREFITVFGSAALWPLVARAQVHDFARKIGVIMNYANSDPEGLKRFVALREELQKLGWVEDRKVRIEVHWAAGQADRMRAYASKLVSWSADIIVGNSAPLLAALKPLAIPIVFTQVADPVGSGFVSNFAGPAGNITGFADFDASIAGKWMEVLKEAAPFVNRVTVLHDPSQRNHEAFLRVIDTAAISLKLEVSRAAVHDEPAIERAIAVLASQTDRGLLVLPGPVNNTHRRAILQAVVQYRPSILSNSEGCSTTGSINWNNGPKPRDTSTVSSGAKSLATFRYRHQPSSS
jgi:putative ABC transport system substrate-binding protein